ncbi:Rne/Rng family ribonuclease [Dethiosulfatarculus sandiegensis]|uniref:Ribonuclease G n=1 Tax=Dethiosulfatarculus sandiegensis TaxID=1429043 RepID=A0A0D2HRC5_9BACT|nr:Rne/Rng family ribonuclease [Dethiosulfatarculus sandiegensis]KIX13098.1 ribonuclease [Dethiosulfatarculus sandiegensis]
MSCTLLINARNYETRVALVENGQCVEINVERHSRGSLAGNVYLGRVVRVLPGMQAAFVDVGLDKAAFLYVGDVQCEADVGDTVGVVSRTNSNLRIEELLKQGSHIMVQVAKEPLGSKGARLTTHITLPGRNLVYMPTIDHVGVSRRIEDEEERNRLRSVLEGMRPEGRGFIARTVSQGQEEDKLKAEMDFLISLWDAINRRRHTAGVPSLLHQDLSVSLRAVRDLFTRDVDHLVIDNEEEYRQVVEFVSNFIPRLMPCVEHYKGAEPIFESYGVETELSRSLGRSVWLKSGGYIIIEKTEALTAVDVNTGRYVGGHDLEETIFKTNLEAVKEIAFQLRLRDIGGLIVIDFIDMERPSHRQRVVDALKAALATDRARTKVLGMSALGLVEMTRKRVRESFAETIKEPCHYCRGLGNIKKPTTVCFELFRTLEGEFAEEPGESVHLSVHPKVAEELMQEERQALEEVEERLKLTLHVEADPKLHVEQYVIKRD